MGLRQPSKTAVFFKQAQAGAEQQKKAREQLKKSQALGGSAGAGTQMIAAATGAQQKATQQVRDIAQQAGKDLNVNEGAVGSSTVSTIGGTPVAPSPTPTATAQQFTGGVGTYKPSEPIATIASGEGGDVDAVTASGTAVQNQITSVTNAINDLNNKIASADTSDRKALQDEKTRLEALLTTYQEKMSKENLGQIAGPSNTEQDMFEREQLLASEVQRVAKLASIFGPGWNAKRYGGLASQIYGKDLEAIQEAAGAGLEAGERASRQAEAAEEEYAGQIETSKKGYEERLKKESDKLDLLKATPQELAGYSRKELTDLFGKDIVDRLFTFSGTDDAAKVTNTKMSETRKALEDRLTQLGTEKEKIGAEVEKAKTVREEEFKKVDKEFFGDVNNKGSINNLKEEVNTIDANASRIVQKIDEITSSMFAREWKGISRDSSIALNIKRMAEGVRPAQIKLIQQMEKAKADKNTAELKRLGEELRTINKNLRQKINEEWSKMTENARRL